MSSRKSKGGYDGKIAGLYDLEETIGKGHFAVVKLARHVFTGEKVAVKVIDKTKLDEVSRSHLFQEVRCMKLVQHPNVVRLYEVIDTQTKLYLILELGDGGDMYDYIMKHKGGLEERVAKRYFRQIVEAISYCHKLHVVHRDLKPENVVFFEKLGLVKLTDFGFSNMFAPGKKLETSCGSLAYSAPEILLGDSYDAPAVDVWSLGVILFMLVVGEPPFHEANDSETLTMIMDCKYDIPSHISDNCRDLIGQMLLREPHRRASLSSIMSHDWLNEGDLTPICHFLPLLTKEMISEDDQTYVIQRMVDGKIASREEILSSIDKNAYNYITATYYLLVERRLRKHQQHEHTLLQQQPSSGSLRKQSAPSPSRSAKPHLEPLMLSPRAASAYIPVSWNGLISPPPMVTVSEFDESSKQKELKKTKTAPIPPSRRPASGVIAFDSPAILVSPPVEESSVSSPAPYFVKSLTTSMTLDRRKGAKKPPLPPPHPLSGKAAAGAGAGGAVSQTAEGAKSSTSKTGQKKPLSSAAGAGKEAPAMPLKSIMTKSDPGSLMTAGAKKTGPISKIALLSSFFERKARQAAGEKDQRFNLGWLRGRNRQPDFIRQRIMEKLETPSSPPAIVIGCLTGTKRHEDANPSASAHSLPESQASDSPADASGTSHYVQSLVSPPGTHPSSYTGAPHLPSTPSPTESHNLLLPPPPVLAVRKCSLIREESVDEYDDEEDECDMDPATIKPVKSLESLDDLASGIIHSGHMSSSSASLTSPPGASSSGNDSLQSRPRPLKSVCSSPQLLNQIHEENESEDDDDLVPLKLNTSRQYSRSGSSSGSSNRQPSNASPEILRKYEQRKKRRGTQRGTSCSSSDASDTDDTEGRSRKDKLRHKFVHRRDSSDHSSDTDGPSGPSGNGRLGSGNGGGSSSSRHTQNGNGGGGGSGGGGGGGNSGGGGGNGKSGGNGDNSDKKENTVENKNQNNKDSTNNYKNSRYLSNSGESQSLKGSLTESSLKILTRKLSDISNGVGSLLTDCRGSDCDNDSFSYRKTPSDPQTPDRSGSLERNRSLDCPVSGSLDHNGSMGSGSLNRHSRNTSLRSSSSSRGGLESTLYPLSEKGPTISPRPSSVQYIGQSLTDMGSMCGCHQSQEFSEISSLVGEEDAVCRMAVVVEQCHKVSDTSAPCRPADTALHCKPSAPNRASAVVPVKSKCCSVV